MRLNNNSTLFLFYLGVMLILTYLQQEFVLLPELQSFDLVGEDAKALLMEKWQKSRWLAFLVAPIMLPLRLSLISLCLFIGSFLVTEMSGYKFKDWWSVVLRAQAVMLCYSICICVINICFGSEKTVYAISHMSLMFLGGEDMASWLRVPLSAVNLFEIIYWFVMAWLVGKLTNNRFFKSFKFVMSSYGVGYLFYIVLLMFLVLYLS